MAIGMKTYKNKLMSNNTLQDKLNSNQQSNVVNANNSLNANASDDLNVNQTNEDGYNYGGNYTWRDYADMISAKTANSKMELQSAMQRAQSASNEYLKAMGLQGSGVGQSQLTDIGTQYQNAIANATKQAEYDVNSQLDTDLKSMVDRGASAREVNSFINQYGDKLNKSNEWNSYAQEGGTTYDNEVSLVLKDLTNMENNTYERDGEKVEMNSQQINTAKKLKNAIIEADKNHDEDQFYYLIEKYENFLKYGENNTANNALPDKLNISEKTIKETGYETVPKDVITKMYSLQYKDGWTLKNIPGKWAKVGGVGQDIYVMYGNDGRFTVVKNGKTYDVDHDGVVKLINNE